MEFRHGLGIFYAAVGTLFFATSPIFTLLIQGISPGGIAFLRMFLGSMFYPGFCKTAGKKDNNPRNGPEKIPPLRIHCCNALFILYLFAVLYYNSPQPEYCLYRPYFCNPVIQFSIKGTPAKI